MLDGSQNGTLVPAGHNIDVVDTGEMTASEPVLPKTFPAYPNPLLKEFLNYYRIPCGIHDHSVNSAGAQNTTEPLLFMNMPLSENAEALLSLLMVSLQYNDNRC